jgi:hypothetical protein
MGLIPVLEDDGMRMVVVAYRLLTYLLTYSLTHSLTPWC